MHFEQLQKPAFLPFAKNSALFAEKQLQTKDRFKPKKTLAQTF